MVGAAVGQGKIERDIKTPSRTKTYPLALNSPNRMDENYKREG